MFCLCAFTQDFLQFYVGSLCWLQWQLSATSGLAVAQRQQCCQHTVSVCCLPLLSQKYCKETAHVKLLRDGKVVTCDIVVDAPARLIPFHIKVRSL